MELASTSSSVQNLLSSSLTSISAKHKSTMDIKSHIWIVNVDKKLFYNSYCKVILVMVGHLKNWEIQL